MSRMIKVKKPLVIAFATGSIILGGFIYVAVSYNFLQRVPKAGPVRAADNTDRPTLDASAPAAAEPVATPVTPKATPPANSSVVQGVSDARTIHPAPDTSKSTAITSKATDEATKSLTQSLSSGVKKIVNNIL